MSRPRNRITILLACCSTRALRITRRQAGAAALGLARPALGGAGGAALGLAAPARAVEEVRSPRPLAYRILKGDPPLMQPYEQRAAPKLLKSLADGADAVLLGVKRNDPEDYALAADLASKFASAAKRPVAVGLDAMPLGSSLREAASWPSVQGPVDFLQPIADLQQRTRCDLVPLGVQAEVMGAVQRSGGIAALSEQQRNAYVDDVGAFVRYPKQTAAFDVWAERVVARTYKKRYEGLEGAPRYEDYFASSILYDEAVASLAARYCRAHPSTLLVCVVSDDHVKFGCSAQGRFQRLEKNPDGDAGFFRAPSILLNPSAESTGSLSRSLRLALAVDPAKARTCSDCVWFSRSPPPSLLTHMMNPVDGAAFKIDLGLSMPTV